MAVILESAHFKQRGESAGKEGKTATAAMNTTDFGLWAGSPISPPVTAGLSPWLLEPYSGIEEVEMK